MSSSAARALYCASSSQIVGSTLGDTKDLALANGGMSTKASRQSTLGYTHGSSLSVDRCTSYELDGDARHRQGFYPGSAAVRA